MGPQNGSSCKNFQILGAKKRDPKIRNTEPKKSVPGGFLANIIIRRGPFRGTVFWTPETCSKACFSGPFPGDLNFIRNARELCEKCKKKRIHQSIHPENPSLPHLDIAVAGHAPHMATSSGKMPIKAHICFLFCRRRRARAY